MSSTVSLLKKIDYANLFDDTRDLTDNYSIILNHYMLYNTHTVYYFNKGRKSIHSSIYDQLTLTHPDTGNGYLGYHGYMIFDSIYDKIDHFTSKYVLPINESDIQVFQELYNEFYYLKRINGKSVKHISDIINKIYNDYTECTKKFNVVPFKSNLPLSNFYNTKEEIYKIYASDYFCSNKKEDELCRIL